MRTVIYARYSSQLQNSRSIEDQIALCRELAEREGWPIVDVFTDYAIGGAAGIGESGRPGLNAALAAIESGAAAQLLADSTSRIARHQGDAYAIRERIVFAGGRIFTLADGEVDAITGWVKGFLDAQQRVDLAHNIRRGQNGTAKSGRSPAGLAYGYRTANRIDEATGRAIRGLREIVEEEAEVVRRIFSEYGSGDSPRAIALRLNAEGVPGPRGNAWDASTIAGDRKRGNGILNNALYAGRLVFNRTRKVVDPQTRRTLIRINDAAQIVEQAVPHLRIVDDALWARAQALREHHATGRPHTQRRPKHLLSGLAVCGTCGGNYSVRTANSWGCGRASRGACSNNRFIATAELERRVLAGLTDKMLDPDAVSLFVREYTAERSRLRKAAEKDREKGRKLLADAEARIGRLVAAIEHGADIEEVRTALEKARQQKAEAVAILSDHDAGAEILTLHPRLVDDYRKQVTELGRAVQQPEARIEAVPILRSLIERVVLTPAEKGRGCAVAVEGRLTNLLALATGKAPDVLLTAKLERVKGSAHYRTFTATRA